jgi:CheY-like chemotaxis protein
VKQPAFQCREAGNRGKNAYTLNKNRRPDRAPLEARSVSPDIGNGTSMTTKASQFPILLVEDDEIDTETVKRILRKEQISNPLYCVSDGVEALDLLKKENGDAIAQPCVILLDINMPRMNGLEFLEHMRGDDRLKRNVTFMLTTSARNEDKAMAYNLCVAGYVLKENMGRLIEMLGRYSRINELPEAGEVF